MNEIERARQVYVKRDSNPRYKNYWALSNPVVLHLLHERERVALRALFKERDILSDAKLLDVGCGTGAEFSTYVRWGVRPSQIHGVDISSHRIDQAMLRQLGNPRLIDGGIFPYQDASFDIVTQNVVFSSILDVGTRQALAEEMLRVLKPDGIILWYDACSPLTNREYFRSVSISEVQGMFPNVRWDWTRLTTHEGMLRRLHKFFGLPAIQLISWFPIFKTHVFGLGKKSFSS